jgi:hypothetical protein
VSGPRGTVREPEAFSSDDENKLRFRGSDVGWFTALEEAYICDAILFNFPNLYVRLYWIRDIKDRVSSRKYAKVFLPFLHRAHKPSEHG